jgi:hypothetical protein
MEKMALHTKVILFLDSKDMIMATSCIDQTVLR